jgi:hypothetical protein
LQTTTKEKGGVYVLCPLSYVTGGTEALHQLVDAINGCGGQACIVYYIGSRLGIRAPKPLKFRVYDAPLATQVKDIPENQIVVPEVDSHLLSLFRNCKKSLWWLSFNHFSQDVFHFDSSIFHYCQSRYVHSKLKERGILNLAMLSDYIHLRKRQKSESKHDMITYSVVKSKGNYHGLIDELSLKYEVHEIKGLSSKKINQILGRSKVFLDFGPQPGKDRLPREAASHDNVVLTTKEGAAHHFEDVGIDIEFKCLDSLNLQELTDLIKDCVVNYDDKIKSQKPYREQVKKDKAVFTSEVKELFDLNGTYKSRIKTNLHLIDFFENVFVTFGLSDIGWRLTRIAYRIL